jgi:hypothetical protein
MSIHKVGDLLVRVHYHKKFNRSCDTFGTIIEFTPDLYYKVWWWDNTITGQKPHLHSAMEIFKYKENLKEWLEICQ